VIIIGEKINASLSDVKEIIQEKDQESLLNLARMQTSAGSDYIDVNVGTGMGSQKNEIQDMAWAVENIQRVLDTPVCIDSAHSSVLEAGLKVRASRPSLINSVKAEKGSLERVLPLARKFDASIVALAMDETGIPRAVESRLAACEKIAKACESIGIPLNYVYFDPLVLPISTDIEQGRVTLNTLMAVKKRFPMAKTAVGLSNISYGLPSRAVLNAAFLHMAVFAGLDAAIMNPLDQGLMSAVRTAEVLVGSDRRCKRYLRAFRT
jgi:5-methyltetrahydrofolate--homocysteine methyltransferase